MTNLLFIFFKGSECGSLYMVLTGAPTYFTFIVMTAPFDSLQDTGQLVQWREPCHPGHVGVTHCFVACGTTPFTSSVTTTLTKTKRLCKKHFKDLSINNRMIKQWWCDIPFLLSGCRVSWFTPSYYTLFSDGSIYRASQNRPWNFGTYGQKTTVAHTCCCDPLNIWNDSYVSTLVTKHRYDPM